MVAPWPIFMGPTARTWRPQLLAEGLGFLVAVAPNVDLVACQQAAERSARAARLGLWRQSPVREAGQIRQSGFAVVSGRVSKVERNRGGDLDRTAGLPGITGCTQSGRQFDNALLKGLQGQDIEARGWVLDRSRRGGLKSGQARWLSLDRSRHAAIGTIRKIVDIFLSIVNS